MGLGDLEAVAACGEGCDRRSVDDFAGVCLDMASIASSFVSSILNATKWLKPFQRAQAHWILMTASDA